jgi:hypothetical protein
VAAGLPCDTDGMASEAARITPGARALGTFLEISIEGVREEPLVKPVSVISEGRGPDHPFNPQMSFPVSFPAGALVERHRAP